MPAFHEHDSVVASSAAKIAAALSERLGDLTRSVGDIMVTEINDLRDEQLRHLLHDCVRATIGTVLFGIEHRIPLRQVEPPTAALEHARRLAQRGVSMDALLRGYQLGQKKMINVALHEVAAHNLDPQLSLNVSAQIADATLGYVDWICQRATCTFLDERNRWKQNPHIARASWVHEILSGEPVLNPDAVSLAIRYPLERVHLAAVAWREVSAGRDDLVAIERFVSRLCQSLGTRERPLFIPVDHLTGWAWIPLTPDQSATAIHRVHQFAETQADAPMLALGMPLCGVEGFRRSHAQAQDARIVAVTLGFNAQRVTAADQPGLSMAALLLRGNVAAARAWVGDVLGPLASFTDNDERLRETLRVFLHRGSSFKAAADELRLHPNSVKYRVRRALERRGRPITTDRLDVEVALLLCQWCGPDVLDRG
ncbi:CdaR family transcriptional regulator [Mycobacterium sp. 1245805.9]|uniref:PucR family transcriptional regulator n=1 Tax=Mycobacterium sp. 1245805.9 TaxID=1856862 RepID=UPI0007FC9DB1|nr:helix-turn-helix domain-containing protein [Mycobacterium sp. 1245805.9]OBI84571.1 hypothetical protein A9X00_03075 [Mycobacterium sp. 1245805.9]